jgi:hypothetical protein
MPTQTENVIALDPGERTGWATAIMGPDSFEFTGYGVFPRRDMALWLAVYQGIRYDARRWSPPTYDRMVWEAWIPRRQNGSMDWIEGDRLLSPRHVGHFELIAWMSGTPTWEYGADRKKLFQASMPPQLEALQAEASEQHPKDALMHLWGWFFSNWFTATKTPEACIVTP